MRLRVRMPAVGVDPERSRRARAAKRKGQAEERKGDQLIASLGARGKVVRIGTTRRAGDFQGTMQTPGIADRVYFVRPVGGGKTRAFWWECKAGTGRLSPAQREFRAWCEAAGWDHVVGDFGELVRWLVREGLLPATSVAHYYTEPAS